MCVSERFEGSHRDFPPCVTEYVISKVFYQCVYVCSYACIYPVTMLCFLAVLIFEQIKPQIEIETEN